MAEGDSSPNFDAFPGAAPGAEAARESQEQFAERYRQAQAAIKKIQQEEQRKKAQDTSLAGVISAFLQDPKRTPFFLLIARLVAQNLPSDLILALIALIHKPAADEIDTKLLALPRGQSNAMTVKKAPDAAFSPDEKNEIDAWTNGIMRIAKTEPQRVLGAAREPSGIADPELVGLFALVLREFLESRGHTEIEMENLTAFGMAFFGRVFDELDKLAGETFLLEEA